MNAPDIILRLKRSWAVLVRLRGPRPQEAPTLAGVGLSKDESSRPIPGTRELPYP